MTKFIERRTLRSLFFYFLVILKMFVIKEQTGEIVSCNGLEKTYYS